MLHRENEQSKFIGAFPGVKGINGPIDTMAVNAPSRAAVDFSTKLGSVNVFINHHRQLGSTVERTGSVPNFRIRPETFQHAFVMEYMKHDRSFPRESSDKLEGVAHEDYINTARLLRKSIAIPGGIDIALYPDDTPVTEHDLWASKFAKDAFKHVTEDDATGNRIPPYIKSIYKPRSEYISGSKEKVFDYIIGLHRLKEVLAHVENPVVIKHVIKKSISESKERWNAATFDFDKRTERGTFEAIGRVAFKNNRLVVRKAILDAIDHDKWSSTGHHGTTSYSYFHQIPRGFTCDFLKRSSIGHDSKEIKDKELRKFKKEARKLLVDRGCIKYERDTRQLDLDDARRGIPAGFPIHRL
jgi:hypothetical protein